MNIKDIKIILRAVVTAHRAGINASIPDAALQLRVAAIKEMGMRAYIYAMLNSTASTPAYQVQLYTNGCGCETLYQVPVVDYVCPLIDVLMRHFTPETLPIRVVLPTGVELVL